MKDKKYIIGVDLGGTKIMTGAIDTDGQVLGTPIKVDTKASEPAENIIKRITDSIDTVIDNLRIDTSEILGIGIGSTGPLDLQKGMILDCPQLPNMQYFPLRAVIEDYYNLPVALNNDANCLILAENTFGVAKGSSKVVGFTLGTGIGCAILFDGKIYNGATGTAGEIWASPFENGTIEDYVSGEGVSRIYQKLGGDNRSAFEIHQLAHNGDPIALKTWQEFGKYVSIAISWSINLMDPEVVVIGGSISKAADFFMPELERQLKKQICELPAERTQIKIAQLGDYAGFIGAAALILQDKKQFNHHPTRIHKYD